LGICVFLLVFARVAWRSVASPPALPPGPRWMELAAKALQGALYLLFFAVPLIAIAGAWLEGHPLTFLAGLQVAPLLPLAHDAGAQVASVHTWLGDALLWLAGLHAVAAIFHHIFLKDEVLVSMLPRWTRLQRRA
ncbi:MAG TPA: cytochrome b/b6 domain-containing protein, partial [Usitatibacter sp.]